MDFSFHSLKNTALHVVDLVYWANQGPLTFCVWRVCFICLTLVPALSYGLVIYWKISFAAGKFTYNSCLVCWHCLVECPIKPDHHSDLLSASLSTGLPHLQLNISIMCKWWEHFTVPHCLMIMHEFLSWTMEALLYPSLFLVPLLLFPILQYVFLPYSISFHCLEVKDFSLCLESHPCGKLSFIS